MRRPLVRWAALLHDIGKVPTRTFTARRRALPRSRRGRRAHVRQGAPAVRVRARRAPDDPLPRQASPAHEPVQRAVDRQRGAPVPSRDGSAHDRPARSVARRHHVEAARAAASSCSSRSARSPIASSALAEEDAKLPPLPGGVGNAIMDGVRAAAVAADRRSQARARDARSSSGELEAAPRGRVLRRAPRARGPGPERRARRSAHAADRSRRRWSATRRATPTTISKARTRASIATIRSPGVLACGHDPDNDPCVHRDADPDDPRPPPQLSGQGREHRRDRVNARPRVARLD